MKEIVMAASLLKIYLELILPIILRMPGKRSQMRQKLSHTIVL